MARKGYGRAESRVRLTFNSEKAARFALEYLTSLRGKQWVKEEDAITPGKPGDKVVVLFTWFSEAHNEHNTEHDIRTKVGNRFKGRPNFIMHNVEVLNSRWTLVRCDDHDNCCQTSPHKRTNVTRRTCACMDRFMQAYCPDCLARPGELCTWDKPLPSGLMPFRLHKSREHEYRSDVAMREGTARWHQELVAAGIPIPPPPF